MALQKKMKIYQAMDETEKDSFTWISHFAFGGGAGALFPLVLGKEETASTSLAKGVAYGVGVWAANYLGIMPRLGVIDHPSQQPGRHVALEIISHVVWGAALGILTQKLGKPSRS